MRKAFTNEFTGEVFTDENECIKVEKESKKNFIQNLIAKMDLIKDICNSHTYCENCPFNNVDCIVSAFTDNYLNIVHDLQNGLQKID